MNKENASKLWKIIQKAGDYLQDQLQFDERIRDIVYDKQSNLYYIYFEDTPTPSLGILSKIDIR